MLLIKRLAKIRIIFTVPQMYFKMISHVINNSYFIFRRKDLNRKLVKVLINYYEIITFYGANGKE